MADDAGSTGEPRSIVRLLQTKTAITTIVAIIAAAITLGKWGDNAWHWIRGDSQSSTPLHPVRLSVAAEHRAPTAAQFSVDGETDGVSGRFCTLRWTTYDAVNDEQLRGAGFTGRRRIRLDHLDRRVEQRLVCDHPPRLDPAGRGDDHLRPSVLDAGRELVRGEAAEDDGVDRADARAREHRDHRLGDHRHVDDDAVASLDSLGRERAREARDGVAQLAVGEGCGGVGDGRVVDERELVGAAVLDVPVERVVARVQPAAGEPAEERCARVVERARRRLHPVDRGRSFRPEAFRILQRAPVDLVEAAHDAVAEYRRGARA